MGDNILKLTRPADFVTLLNALFGFASIIMTIQGRVDDALIMILLAVLADGADGAFARYLGSGVLGANLDSLADVISFGVAPAVLAFVFLDWMGSLAWAFAGLFLACGILRLARFNVAGKKEGFEGIPITAGGLMVALFILIKDYVPYFEYMLVPFLVLLSLLMVSTIGYPKLKSPVLLAPLGIFFITVIAVYYLGYPDTIRFALLLIFILAFAYILSPLGRRLYDRSKRAG